MKQRNIDFLKRLDDVVLHGDETRDFTRISYDTRVISDPPRSCFVALRGSMNDGHRYIKEAYAMGVRCFLVEALPEAEYTDALFAIVPDSLSALQQLAAMHRKQFNLPVVAITGSNGKTIVKEWINQLLRSEKRITRSPRSYNSQLGVALSLWLIAKEDELALIEAGISEPGEMARLERMIEPSVGVFTYAGVAHLENFRDSEELYDEKCKLFSACDRVYYCSDQTEISAALARTGFEKERVQWSAIDETAALFVEQIDHSKKAVRLRWQNEGHTVYLPSTDPVSVHNAMTALLVALDLSASPEALFTKASGLTPIAMRMERIDGWGNSSIISDIYNSDLPTLEIALDELQRTKADRKVVIMSDILQSGLPGEELYRRVNEQLVNHKVDQLVAIGEAISEHASDFTLPVITYPHTQGFIEDLDTSDWHNSAILLKGARKFRFEDILLVMQERVHETVLEIDLSRIVTNLNFYRRHLNNGVKVMAMVKAFGYGTGGTEIAELLEYHHVDQLGVAYVNEGVALRKAGIILPIFVLNPDEAAFAQMIDHRLEPEVYSMRQARALIAELERRHQKDYPIHLKIDTGMHRLGFDPQTLEEVIDLISDTECVRVKGVLSHLAAADDPRHDAFTETQISKFTTAVERVTERLGYQPERHICNTAGSLRFPDAHFEMVRLGIGLYGVAACDIDRGKVVQAAIFKTRISQLRTVVAGESVGYTRSGSADHERMIATIPIGYADGFRRSLSNGRGFVSIAGKRAPVVGKVCMDMTMVDVTGLDVSEGDEVIIFGDDPTVEEMAQAADTIPYEIISGISQRVKRIYVKG